MNNSQIRVLATAHSLETYKASPHMHHSHASNNAFDGKYRCSSITRKIRATCAHNHNEVEDLTTGHHIAAVEGSIKAKLY